MDVAIYLRKSRAEEKEDTVETLKRHKTVLLRYVESHGLTLIDTYEEVVSGESLYSRPQMLMLLECVEHGQYEAVLCMDIDRLGRGGMQDQGVILDTFKYSDTKIITPDKTYDLNDELDEELTEFKTFISRREYKIINKRLRRGLSQVIDEGCYVANAPYGYRKVYKDKRPTLEIFEEEAKFVRMIFNMYCEGMGCSSIADTLNSLGVKPHRSDSFGRTSIMHILRNPTFTGKIVWNRKKHIRKGAKGNPKHITIYQPKENWKIVDGIHPAIISEEQFEEAQNIAKSRYIPPSNNGTIKSPLAGLIKCKNCGKYMQRMNMHKGIGYLLCNTRGCCAGTKYEFVEEAIIQSLKTNFEKLNAEVESRQVDFIPYETALSNTCNELDKTIGQKEKLHTLLEQDVYSIDTYKERMNIILEKIAALELQKASAQKAIIKAKREEKDILESGIRNVLEAYGTADAQIKNKMLKSVIDYVVYDKKKKTKPHEFCLNIVLKTYIS